MPAASIQKGYTPGTALNVALWTAQVLIAVAFVGIGGWKLTTPIADLAAAIKWPGEFPPWFVRGLGVIDIAGGLGVILPMATRIAPSLTSAAAAGCCALQVCAILFHASRGEFAVLPLNFVLLPLASFILWGRRPRRFANPLSGVELATSVEGKRADI